MEELKPCQQPRQNLWYTWLQHKAWACALVCWVFCTNGGCSFSQSWEFASTKRTALPCSLSVVHGGLWETQKHTKLSLCFVFDCSTVLLWHFRRPHPQSRCLLSILCSPLLHGFCSESFGFQEPAHTSSWKQQWWVLVQDSLMQVWWQLLKCLVHVHTWSYFLSVRSVFSRGQSDSLQSMHSHPLMLLCKFCCVHRDGTQWLGWLLQRL